MKSFYFVAEVPANEPHKMKLHVQPTADREACTTAYQSLAHGKDLKKVSKGATLALGTLDFIRTHRAAVAALNTIDTTPDTKA